MEAYRPHSRIIREVPIKTLTKFPKALRAMRKFSPLRPFPVPKTASKKRLADVWAADWSLALGTGPFVSHSVRIGAEILTYQRQRRPH